MNRSIPVLLYHHVSPERDITPQGFETQMRHLLDQGYECLSMAEVVRTARGEIKSDRPSFALTFDDGYANNEEHAFPILKKLMLKATIYLVTDRVGTEGFLSWAQVKAMKASGLITFGSHSRTHRHFVRREPYGNVEEELQGSKRAIESQLGEPCDHLAWPWGDYEDAWLPLVKQIGYSSAATTLAGANSKGSDPFTLRRINMRRPSAAWLEKRLRWNRFAVPARAFGLFYGWDRRLKVWWNRESPYSHG